MKCGHLFNGIGGFPLAASWMGWENIMHCEIDPFCNRVMNHHFPNSFQHEDIRTTDFTIWRGKIDLLTGGFPCQPYSTAGKRKGTADDRHLWPEMLRAIREISPRWIVPENVRGLTNWNGGLVFDQVQADMEAEGYEVIPFLLPAAGVNAPHRRDRIWFVAYSGSLGYSRRQASSQGQQYDSGREARGIIASPGSAWSFGNSFQYGLEGTIYHGNGKEARAGIEPGSTTVGADSKVDWQNFPSEPPVCSGDDGISGELADITFSTWRIESLKCLGNAIVPKSAFQIFKGIERFERTILI